MTRDADKLKSEIYTYGPLETGFTVYEDFFSYSSGVYQHLSGDEVGGHAVKIIGWGNESGVDYWLCANSWSSSWGEDGFFKIKVGECGIATENYGCYPDLDSA